LILGTKSLEVKIDKYWTENVFDTNTSSNETENIPKHENTTSSSSASSRASL
jgi:hypothetical protein